MYTTRSQRWRDRRARWVPAASEIDPRRLAIDVIDTHKIAAPFVRAHHYAASLPVTRLSVGLFADGAGGRSELVGVCVFSHPVNDASVPRNAGLKNPRAACDLGRLVVLDSQGGNAESFLVARAFRLLRREKPEILSVISYADPVRRTDANGEVFMPGHVGGLYAVMAARYVGGGGGQSAHRPDHARRSPDLVARAVEDPQRRMRPALCDRRSAARRRPSAAAGRGKVRVAGGARTIRLPAAPASSGMPRLCVPADPRGPARREERARARLSRHRSRRIGR